MVKKFVEDSLSITPKSLISGALFSLNINYWRDKKGDDSVWFISVGGFDTQELHVEFEEITYGSKPYFKCDCGSRVSKLYLPRNGQNFGCRTCHNLCYQLNTLSKNSVAGGALYRLNRLSKLSDSRANISHIFYKGDYTKKFKRFLNLCGNAGLNDVVDNANNLKALISG